MDIEKAKQEKEALEKIVEYKIKEFEEKTGLEVKYLYVYKLANGGIKAEIEI
mgnify:CR=1 FL=1